MPCQCGYPDGMSPLGRMVFPRAPPSGNPSSLWETFHQDTHTGMAYLYIVVSRSTEILSIVHSRSNEQLIIVHSGSNEQLIIVHSRSNEQLIIVYSRSNEK